MVFIVKSNQQLQQSLTLPGVRFIPVLFVPAVVQACLQCLGVFLPNNPIQIALISWSGEAVKVRNNPTCRAPKIIEYLNILLEDD